MIRQGTLNEGNLENLALKLGWAAQYIAMRALDEPDAFPAADLGIIKALQQGNKLPTLKQILERSEEWRPWRAYTAIYL